MPRARLAATSRAFSMRGGRNGRLDAEATTIGKRKGMYWAHISIDGSIKYGQLFGPVGVLEVLDNPTPIGIATCRGCEATGLAWWTLTVHGKTLPGFWVIVDRQFHEVQ